jgi:23S rRNA U2552 (ribose-2'-O)-methylase RlmE/FtsJ
MTKTIALYDDTKIHIKQITGLIDYNLYQRLLCYKNKIDKLNFQNEWDTAKKLGNDYELIYLPNKKNKTNSIACYQPLSRSYFKLWEMIYDFKLLNNDYKHNILCMAEGPGGFIEAITNYRKQKLSIVTDTIIGITLKSVNKDIPGWKKSSIFLKNNKNIKITYGSDNTGNLYNVDNILYLKNKYNKMHFITADGGFDFSNNFNKQEEIGYKIIFCEIVTALCTQKEGGAFVCKIFDSYTHLTIKFLYLLNNYYETVYITKPYTSRPANSEKYIVCLNFKQIDESILNLLLDIVKNWDNLDTKNILNFIDLPYIFVKKIKIFNNVLTERQINNIEKTLSLINEQENSEVIQNQIECAKKWCTKYNIKINKFSMYL